MQRTEIKCHLAQFMHKSRVKIKQSDAKVKSWMLLWCNVKQFTNFTGISFFFIIPILSFPLLYSIILFYILTIRKRKRKKKQFCCFVMKTNNLQFIAKKTTLTLTHKPKHRSVRRKLNKFVHHYGYMYSFRFLWILQHRTIRTLNVECWIVRCSKERKKKTVQSTEIATNSEERQKKTMFFNWKKFKREKWCLKWWQRPQYKKL